MREGPALEALERAAEMEITRRGLEALQEYLALEAGALTDDHLHRLILACFPANSRRSVGAPEGAIHQDTILRHSGMRPMSRYCYSWGVTLPGPIHSTH